ncbi:hypothetical protein [Neolewinella persica]|uniref:hypothetical protein n=1 Tax=Neolewinella persica TaxID=70998 RepID=UPI00036888FE|nr:hypothetical protein [Neolewinella persica]
MRYFSQLILLFLVLLFTACGGGEATTETTDDTATEAVPEPAMKAVALAPMPATKSFPDAKIDGWKYRDGTFTYETSGYEFAVPTPDAGSIMCANSGKGQHAHLIIDNEPYIAKYEPTFEQAVADGEHHILTFLSRSYHESIKNGQAHRAVKATTMKGNFTEIAEIKTPMLFYSRPKGTYVGNKETQNVMLDFFPVNAPLGAEYQVKAVVNGQDEFMIDEWRPYYLTGLPMGENTVELTLMKDGVAVDAPLNPVTRTFNLEADPAGK